PGQIDAIGFSAGGHLAASLATGSAEPVYAPADATDRLDAPPRAVGLIYPVIKHPPRLRHAESTRLLLGTHPDAALVARGTPAAHWLDLFAAWLETHAG